MILSNCTFSPTCGMLIEKSFMQSNLNRDELHLLLDHIPDSEVAMAAKFCARSPIQWNLHY